METSQSIINISKALLKAQKSMENATKESKNPFFKSKYADLVSVMEACKKPLNDAGILVTQLVSSTTEGDFVKTMFIHADSGEYIGSTMKLTNIKDMQAFGSAVSYARRYMLQSQAFVAAEDDDGEATVSRSTEVSSEAKEKGSAYRKSTGSI